jgi:signal transduction histidine kinase
MGMGLSVASTIVELHEGSLWVEGRTKGGSTFGVRLPLAQPRMVR